MNMTGFRGWYCEICNSAKNPVICEFFLNWYCPDCDVWLEDFHCLDENCRCKKRPEKPSMVDPEILFL